MLFPEALPGGLKIVCHGRRIDKSQVKRVKLVTIPCFHEVAVRLSKPELLADIPAGFIEEVSPNLPGKKLVDCFGQNKQKDWTIYGGWKRLKLSEGTGYFTKYKKNETWWLVDPDGYAYLSIGPDCVGVPMDCRVDGVEQWLEWLPEEGEKPYESMFAKNRKGHEGTKTNRKVRLFSYIQANLYRVFGEDWFEIWKKMMTGQLKHYGMNTLGNWSDSRLFDDGAIPYVTSLPEFPAAKIKTFRDFPDVFSEEYQMEARRCASLLKEHKDDPMMVGYFLRNEPGWAFVDHLVLADEVLYNPAKTACKEKLIGYLKEKYKTIETLNGTWGSKG